ncbi:MAG TPA: hypothetical protein VFG47_10020, partial [Geminicoccaceae bacterium]|nr:hypothetical protein [Geminicoccaceae bacterium]
PGPPRPAVGAATPPAVAAPGPERRPGAATVAVDGGADLLLGAALGGSWFLELGEYPDGPEALAAWRELRRRYPAALAGLNRLAGIDGAPQSLVVGPVGSGAAARELCLRLKGDGATCRPVLL